MKLSFALSSKPSSNLKKHPSSQTFSGDDPRSSSNPIEKEYVTEFDPSKAASRSTKDTLIIPPKQNEWRPIKRMKNLEVPLQVDSSAADQPLQFELDSGASVEPSLDGMSYGLNVRQSENGNPNPDPNPNPNPKQMIDPMLHKFKEDLKRLPEHNGIDEYTDMPVEGYGAALLKGYGWVEGRGIGRNAKEDVKVVEYKRWTAKEGIGFIPEVPKSSSKGEGAGKPAKRKGEEGVKVDHRDGNVEKMDREKGEKGLYVGKEVMVVRGKEMGMKGRILEVKSSRDLVILKLTEQDKEVKLQARDLAELGSVEEERCLKKLLELKIKEEKSNLEGVRKQSSGGRSRDEPTTRRKKESRRSRDERSDEVSWLASHIRVRIICKDLKKGRLYLKKGEIMDVVGPTSCDICMDETRELIQGVDQELLETALPKRGGPVLVLYGRHKGVYGHLVEKDSESETGIVRDADSKELLKVRLEQIAEYLGDPSYIGY